MKRKVVYNACYGGFGLSHEATLLYAEKKGIKLTYTTDRFGGYRYRTHDGEYYYLSGYEIERHDPDLVAVVEELGSEKASGDYASLRVEEVDGPYRIDEYDGTETVETTSSYDWK